MVRIRPGIRLRMANSAMEAAGSSAAPGEGTGEVLFTACMGVRIIIAVMEGMPAPGILRIRRQMKAFLLRGHGGIHTMAQTDNDANSRAEGITAPHGHIPGAAQQRGRKPVSASPTAAASDTLYPMRLFL